MTNATCAFILRHMSYGERLREVLTERGISVRQFAHMWRPDRPDNARFDVYKYFRGQEPRDMRIPREHAEALGMTLEELMGDTSDDAEDRQLEIMRDLLSKLSMMVDDYSRDHKTRGAA